MFTNYSQLLEDYLQNGVKNSPGDGVEDDDDAWREWEVESDSSESSSDSNGWIDVSSDDEQDITIDDSDGERIDSSKPMEQEQEEAGPAKRVSTLATTKVCDLHFQPL
jgi:protein SDA1